MDQRDKNWRGPSLGLKQRVAANLASNLPRWELKRVRTEWHEFGSPVLMVAPKFVAQVKKMSPSLPLLSQFRALLVARLPLTCIDEPFDIYRQPNGKDEILILIAVRSIAL